LTVEELRDLYSSAKNTWVVISRRMTWAEDVACVMQKRYLYRILVVKPEGKRPL
jgi:hypothetical protein